jgi:catechol 2,3-dioxygenase-like protein/intradiol ring-cleaving dioxygenase-like protein
MCTPAAITPQDITDAVIASFERSDDQRLKQLMQALVSHLHAFTREVSLSQDEWRRLCNRRPAHIHMIPRADGYRTVTTHIFDDNSEYLDSDAVFAVKPSLLRHFEQHHAGDTSAPPGVDGGWVSVRNDIVLAT